MTGTVPSSEAIRRTHGDGKTALHHVARAVIVLSTAATLARAVYQPPIGSDNSSPATQTATRGDMSPQTSLISVRGEEQKAGQTQQGKRAHRQQSQREAGIHQTLHSRAQTQSVIYTHEPRANTTNHLSPTISGGVGKEPQLAGKTQAAQLRSQEREAQFLSDQKRAQTINEVVKIDQAALRMTGMSSGASDLLDTVGMKGADNEAIIQSAASLSAESLAAGVVAIATDSYKSSTHVSLIEHIARGDFHDLAGTEFEGLGTLAESLSRGEQKKLATVIAQAQKLFEQAGEGAQIAVSDLSRLYEQNGLPITPIIAGLGFAGVAVAVVRKDPRRALLAVTLAGQLMGAVACAAPQTPERPIVSTIVPQEGQVTISAASVEEKDIIRLVAEKGGYNVILDVATEIAYPKGVYYTAPIVDGKGKLTGQKIIAWIEQNEGHGAVLTATETELVEMDTKMVHKATAFYEVSKDGKKRLAYAILYQQGVTPAQFNNLILEYLVNNPRASKDDIHAFGAKYLYGLLVASSNGGAMWIDKNLSPDIMSQMLAMISDKLEAAQLEGEGPVATSTPFPIATLRPTETSIPTATPAPTVTPLPTNTPPPTPREAPPTPTPAPTPRPEASWVEVNGNSNLLAPGIWNRDFGGGDKRTVTNGKLVVTANKNDWFTEPNPNTKISVKGPFQVIVKMDVSGTGGIILDGRPASGGEWWQGMRRIFIGQDGEPILGFRDGTTSAEQRIKLKSIPSSGVVLRFSADGSTVEILDTDGNYLTVRSGPQRLSQPAFPDGTMTIGTNVKKSSTLTVSDLDVQSPQGVLAWNGAPAAAPVASAPTAPKPAEAKPAPTGRQEIVLKPGNNPFVTAVDQIRTGNAPFNQRQFVQLNIPGANVGNGGPEDIVSEYAIGPIVNRAWRENGKVFLSFTLNGKEIIGEFKSNPTRETEGTPVITTRENGKLSYGHLPEEIPLGAKLGVYFTIGSIETINQNPHPKVEILGIVY